MCSSNVIHSLCTSCDPQVTIRRVIFPSIRPLDTLLLALRLHILTSSRAHHGDSMRCDIRIHGATTANISTTSPPRAPGRTTQPHLPRHTVRRSGDQDQTPSASLPCLAHCQQTNSRGSFSHLLPWERVRIRGIRLASWHLDQLMRACEAILGRR